jgi:hypothetical protein
MRHDFGRLKEVLAVLRWLMKWAEGNSDWDSKRLAKLENQTGNVGAVGAKRALKWQGAVKDSKAEGGETS